ncbi:MAG0920 family protein [Mycoplasma seminis]|uniref:Uncharacterized protein n=1 Tax=Mycoplasma seminis TaxID=512749 RepID=A0ABY9HA94_9MOLU|nr:hypothetical protein [Mycoplasma seminis]WLP85517.1 hypothetical protein Q8852_04335 [Mycoplasma seminis]
MLFDVILYLTIGFIFKSENMLFYYQIYRFRRGLLWNETKLQQLFFDGTWEVWKRIRNKFIIPTFIYCISIFSILVILLIVFISLNISAGQIVCTALLFLNIMSLIIVAVYYQIYVRKPKKLLKEWENLNSSFPNEKLFDNKLDLNNNQAQQIDLIFGKHKFIYLKDSEFYNYKYSERPLNLSIGGGHVWFFLSKSYKVKNKKYFIYKYIILSKDNLFLDGYDFDPHMLIDNYKTYVLEEK